MLFSFAWITTTNNFALLSMANQATELSSSTTNCSVFIPSCLLRVAFDTMSMESKYFSLLCWIYVIMVMWGNSMVVSNQVWMFWLIAVNHLWGNIGMCSGSDIVHVANHGWWKEKKEIRHMSAIVQHSITHDMFSSKYIQQIPYKLTVNLKLFGIFCESFIRWRGIGQNHCDLVNHFEVKGIWYIQSILLFGDYFILMHNDISFHVNILSKCWYTA